MATPQAPDHANQVPDPARLGADQSPATTPEDDSHDMSSVLAETDKDQSPDYAHQQSGVPLGTAFDRQRQQGAEGDGTPNGDVGQAQGMGRTADIGDEDRTYDQNPQRGGLGSSGGRESHADRHPNPDTNAFTGPSHDQPRPAQSENLGLNTPSPSAS